MENIEKLIATYNEKAGTICRSITDIYNIEGSVKAATKLKVCDSSIRKWVVKEGGKLKPQGGYRPKKRTGLHVILVDKGKAFVEQMSDEVLAAYTGYHRTWCNVVRRRVGMPFIKND